MQDEQQPGRAETDTEQTAQQLGDLEVSADAGEQIRGGGFDLGPSRGGSSSPPPGNP